MPKREIWKRYDNIKDVAADIMGSVQKTENKHSIPDVYGRAIQFYFTMEDAYNRDKCDVKDIQLYRGLLAMIALQKVMEFPLFWEHVVLGNNVNAFHTALGYVPHLSAFRNQNAKWNGKDFYVLKWAGDSDDVGKDLLVYNPATLIYPVADIYKVLNDIPGIKWYDYKNSGFFNIVDRLSEPEIKIVYYWLERMESLLQTNKDVDHSITRVILYHLRQFKQELRVSLMDCEKSCFKLISIPNGKKLEEATGVQRIGSTVEVGWLQDEEFIDSNSFFSDQIFYFEINGGKKNPFLQCRNQNAYQIQDKEGWYAFLPLGEKVRNQCGKYSLENYITMTYVQREKDDIIKVRANLSKLASQWTDLYKEYRVCPENESTSKKNIAVLYGEIVPLIAVWPGEISEVWKKYYIMIDESGRNGKLEISETDSCSGDNPYVKQINYVPYAIPLVRKDGKNTYSVGMVIPERQKTPSPDAAVVQAEVAVDFGTSSTRIFATINGREGKQEIHIAEDKPMVITDASKEKRLNMKDYFVSIDKVSDSLFSIYKRPTDKLKKDVMPILDGVIYQSGNNENPGQDKRFMTDLKWSVLYNRKYYSAFIKQLCLHCSHWLYQNYKVNSITWRYAIPYSMDDAGKESMQSSWNNEISAYLNEMSEKITHKIVETYVIESEAASRYFLSDGQHPRVNAEKGFLVVDIGGGSTDVALWQDCNKNVQMKWHTSIQVAGRLMFTRWFLKYLDQFKAYATPTSELSGMIDYVMGMKKDDSMQTVLAERILNGYYDEIFSQYYEECGKAGKDSWTMQFCTKVTQTIFLLMFALGYQIGYMIEKKIFNVPEGKGSFIIVFAGKGSAILNWVEHGENNTNLKDVFLAGVQCAGATLTTHIEIHNNKWPKTEVARGMLESNPHVQMENVQDTVGIVDINSGVHILQALERTYNEVFLNKNNNLGSLSFDENRIANLLDAYSKKECQVIKYFMEIIYHQYLLGKE